MTLTSKICSDEHIVQTIMLRSRAGPILVASCMTSDSFPVVPATSNAVSNIRPTTHHECMLVVAFGHVTKMAVAPFDPPYLKSPCGTQGRINHSGAPYQPKAGVLFSYAFLVISEPRHSLVKNWQLIGAPWQRGALPYP